MLSFDEALQRILLSAKRLGSERVSLRSANGRWLARDVLAPHPLPAFDYSAMDGYALNLGALNQGPPWKLPVCGESRAGCRAERLQDGKACRIFTGAQVPHGANCVLLQEECSVDGDSITFEQVLTEGRHIRRRGEDLKQGAVALRAGQRLNAHSLALAASLDCTTLEVARRPRVCIVCTGDELRPPGQLGPPESIPESNGLAVALQAETAGAQAELAPLTGDSSEALTETLQQVLGTADLVITIGGASVGKYDLVRPALQAAGADLDFWKVRIKPGKPLVHGHCGRTQILGLPGNPVSAQVTFSLFGLPLLRALQGASAPLPPFQERLLLENIHQRPGRMGFFRGLLEPGGVRPLNNQASGNVVSLAVADLLIAVPAEATTLHAGEMVKTLLLSDL